MYSETELPRAMPAGVNNRQSPGGALDEDVDLGRKHQPNNNERNRNSGLDGGGGDSPSPPNNLNQRQQSISQPRVRYRGQKNSPRSVKSKHGRHITNINRINVINNFGTDGGKYFPTPWKRNQHSAKHQLCWCTIRLGLALLILLWLGAMASVMKSSVPPSSSSDNQSKAAMNLAQWKKLSENIVKAGLRGENGIANPSNNSNVKDGDSPTKGNGQAKKKKKPTLKPAASIYELSMFGNQSPSDFQLYTPHAPSCSKPLNADSVSYTLVSQLSHDRLWMVQFHCERWGDNPMSIIVFSDRTAADVKSELVSKGCSEDHLTVQTVSETKYDPARTEYPVNLLRNMAFSAVKTSHIVYADVDFWPSADLHSILSEESIKERLASDPKLATVIPVFQMYRMCRQYKDCRKSNIPKMPKKKNSLLTLIKKKQASTFDPTNVGGHGSTKYITWRDQKAGTFVDLPCIKSNRYEPYLAFRYCSDLPPFQEGFTGYGKNKMTWVMQLRRAGYLFTQLGGAFHVHYPHLDSKAREEWNKKPSAMQKYHKSANELLQKEDSKIDWGKFKRARVDALFLDFKEWLDGTVEDESRTPMCEDALNDDVRLWVHSDKQADDDDEEEEDSEEGDLGGEYNNVVSSKERFDKCQKEHLSNPEECFEEVSDFIESSILWSVAGEESGELNYDDQMKYLTEAEECAVRFLGIRNNDPEFNILVGDLYANMGAIEKARHSTVKAIDYIMKALANNPNDEAAQQILVRLQKGGDSNNELESPADAPDDDGLDDGETTDDEKGAVGGEVIDGAITEES